MRPLINKPGTCYDMKTEQTTVNNNEFFRKLAAKADPKNQTATTVITADQHICKVKQALDFSRNTQKYVRAKRILKPFSKVIDYVCVASSGIRINQVTLKSIFLEYPLSVPTV